MRTAGQIADLSAQLVATSNKLKTASYLRVQKIAAIKASEGRTMDWIQLELTKIGGIEVERALYEQARILNTDLDGERAAWGNLGMVLRLAAMPNGTTPAAATVLGALREEAEALEGDPATLQSQTMDAATGQDWVRLYALTLGRLDADGTPLGRWKGVLRGVPFAALDLPGQEAVMEAFYRARVAWLEAELAFSDAKGEARNYTTAMLLTRAPGDYQEALAARRAALLVTPSEALKRAELERTNPGDRFVKIEAQPGVFAIFDNLIGAIRYIGEAEGPDYLFRLNHPAGA